MSSRQERLSVVKIGGSVLDEQPTMAHFWRGIRELKQAGPVLVVHGGGPQATVMAERLGHQPRFVNGRRVTKLLDRNISLWMLRGELNAKLVAQAQQHGLNAAGLSGVDGQTLQVTRRRPWQIEGETVDFGWVGDVKCVDPALLDGLLAAECVPVIAPLGVDSKGEIYNVNADTVAESLSVALNAARLLFITESGGVDVDSSVSAGSTVDVHPSAKVDSSQDVRASAKVGSSQDVGTSSAERRLRQCSAAAFSAGKERGWIHGGMVVKLEVALRAAREGVREVFIAGADDLVSRNRATRVVP